MSRRPHLNGWVDFEQMVAEIDGVEYPVTNMLDHLRHFTSDPDLCVVFVAGRDDEWMACAVHRELDS
jgi:hypothetical protein